MCKNIAEQSNFIAIGAWNPAIIQPHWLRKYFSDKIPETCQLEITSVGISSAFRMSYPKVFIDPNNGRLVFIPKDFSEETFTYISELSLSVYSKLEHTPVLAAGSNFVFQLEIGEIFAIDESESDISNLYYGFIEQNQIVSKLIRHTLSTKDCSINITYDYLGNDRFLRINFDYQGVDPLKRAAERIVSDYKTSLELKQQLVKVQ